MKCKMKIISFVLVMILLVSACIIPASAYDFMVEQKGFLNPKYMTEFLSAYSTTEEEFLWLSDSQHSAYSYIYGYNENGDEVVDESTPDYILCHFDERWGTWICGSEIIGDYIVTTDSMVYVPYGIGLYIFSVNDNAVYTLKEAWEVQLPNLESVMIYVGGERIGDVDFDDVLTIKDATAIQRHLAGLEPLKNDNHLPIEGMKDIYISDFDKDGERTIKDATAIQKYVAGLEY